MAAGGVLRLFDDAEQVTELCQEEDRLIIRAGGRTRILQWPDVGPAYRRMASDLVGGMAAGWR